jgi:CheY-like chemotaxis protein
MTNEQVYLYVEDDPMSREAVQIVLRRVMGIEQLYVFADSTEFMARVKALPSRPTIILLDIHMQPHNGFELLKMLREDPDYREARIVALTASVMNEEVELLKQSGFDGVIGKPIQVATFPKLMNHISRGELIWHISD